jgi:hypothetical protein
MIELNLNKQINISSGSYLVAVIAGVASAAAI